MAYRERIHGLQRMMERAVHRNQRRLILKRLRFRQRNKQDIPKPTPFHEWQFVKGDVVEIIRGRDEGKQGKIIQVDRTKEAVRVEGCNLRYYKSIGQQNEMETRLRESPILIKNIALVDQDMNIPTLIEHKYTELDHNKGRYQRVRANLVTGDLQPRHPLPKRKIRDRHPQKDTPPSVAEKRTWVGPYEFFTPHQKQYMLSDLKEKHPNLPNIEGRLPDLIFNNVKEVQEYIRMLPYCQHAWFNDGKCVPHMYDHEPTKKWTRNKLYRMTKWQEGPRVISDELKRELERHSNASMPRYFIDPVDPNSYWPRVDPKKDPKYKEKFKAWVEEQMEMEDEGV